MKNTRKKPLFTTSDIALTAMATLFIVLSSYITIPFFIPFTLQTFAIFLTLFFLGGKRGLVAVVAYIALGIAGLPVFSAFGAGLGSLLGPTGGYIVGFVIVASIHLVAEILSKNNRKITIFCDMIALIILHAIGVLWMWTFGFVETSVGVLILTYSLPYLLVDALKLCLAIILARLVSARLGSI